MEFSNFSPLTDLDNLNNTIDLPTLFGLEDIQDCDKRKFL